MQLLCFSRIWYLIMSIERSQAQAVTDVNLEALHDEVLRSCRGKQSRYFLEARCGVGATRSRDYMIRPVVLRDCEFCSSQSYLCLGMGCKGKNKKSAVLVGSQRQQKQDVSQSQPRELPGQVYKTHTSSCRIARNPGPKKSHSLKSSNHPTKTFAPGRKGSGRQSKKERSLIFKVSSPALSRVKKSKVLLRIMFDIYIFLNWHISRALRRKFT